MKGITQYSGYAHRIHIVELENDEPSYSEEKLLHMADNHYKIQDWWPLVETRQRHSGHFGGVVTKDGSKATIKIYTD